MKNKKIHFIGIGGISMSALATYMFMSGYEVQGSDIKTNDETKKLQALGIKIFNNHNANNVKNCNLCIYSGAIDKNNPEIQYALNNGIPIMERSQFLGLIAKDFQKTIAISGSHGKTTTTAMIAKVFLDAKLNPTIHLGGDFDYIGGNFKFGDKAFLITEACEYRKSFLELNPNYSVITNVELDHIDCYKNIEEINQAFKEFIDKTQNIVFLNGDDKFSKSLTQSKKIIKFGTEKTFDYYAYNFREEKNCYTFDVQFDGQYITTIKLNISGYYNALNALACVAVCHKLGIDCPTIKQSLFDFKNVSRRFEFIKSINKANIYKDYAHHPTEIKNVLCNIKKLETGKIICFFQPHTFSRTLGLFNEFLSAFDDCDVLYILPTYSARENPIVGGRAEDLYDSLSRIKKDVYFIKNFTNCSEIIKSYENQNCTILLLGAGDIVEIEQNL